MSVLRAIIVIFGGLLLVAAGLLIASHNSPILIAYFLVGGVVIIIGVIFERGRYKPRTSGENHDWEMTNERFIDDSTGKRMRVRYNRRTGERDYIEED